MLGRQTYQGAQALAGIKAVGETRRERQRENSNYYCWWISVGSWKVFVVALEGEEANLRAVAKIGGEGKNDCGASTYSMMMDRG